MCDNTHTSPLEAFQSSPDPKAGCDALSGGSSREVLDVSILTRPEGRMRQMEDVDGIATYVFQSSPDPKAGCDHALLCPLLHITNVSILTRPEGRMRRCGRPPVCRPARVSILTRPEGRMRLGPGCDCGHTCCVSILTRPEGRMRPPEAAPDVARTESVSILTRPEGRMRREEVRAMLAQLRWFQSSPDPKAGCDPASAPRGCCRRACFNPHPTRRPDATTGRSAGACASYVSILTRPEGRMRHNSARAQDTDHHCFNPHPTRRPDATRRRASHRRSRSRFQSSPDPKAGCDSWTTVTSVPATTFQSSPDPKAGCDPARKVDPVTRGRQVSILTRPEGRMRPMGLLFDPRQQGFQSSPDPKAGCDCPCRCTR